MIPADDLREKLKDRGISISQFARQVGVRRETVHGWMAAGQIPNQSELAVMRFFEKTPPPAAKATKDCFTYRGVEYPTLRQFVKVMFPGYPIYEPVHGEIFDRLTGHLAAVLAGRLDRTSNKRFDLYMIPPGTCKTTVVCNAFPIWALGIEPNLRFLIASEDIDVAAPKVDKCRELIETEDYQKLFPGRVPKKERGVSKEKWTYHSFTVAGRTEIHQEPSMMCAGFRNFPASFHYDFVLFDDPHADQSIKIIDNCWKMTEKTYYRMEPWAALIGICTTWREWDWSHRFREKWVLRLTHKPYIRPLDIGITNSAKQVVSQLPQFWSNEKATAEKAHANQYDWACQMMLDPAKGGDRRFPAAIFERALREIDSLEGCGEIIMCVDFRGIRESVVTNREDTSEDAIFIGTWRQRGTAIGLDCVSGRWDEDGVMDRICEKVRLWKPGIITFENKEFQSFARRLVELRFQELRLDGIKTPRIVTLTRSSDKSKIERIRGWLGDYGKGFCEFSKTMEHLEKFRTQLITFPECKNDVMDLLDVWADFLIVSLEENRVPGFSTEPDELRKGATQQDVARRINQYITAQKQGIDWRPHQSERGLAKWANS